MKTRISRMLVLLAACMAAAAVGGWLDASAARTVSSPIRFVPKGAACVSEKQASVAARSDDSVVWTVTADAGCKYEGQTVAIVFTEGGQPGSCQCSAAVTKNSARLTLKVKKHTAHQTYRYDIRVGGKPVADPRLEIDP